MFKLLLKKKILLIGAAAVVPILFLVVLLGGGGSVINEAERAILSSGAVIEKLTTKAGITIPYASLDGMQAHKVDGELRLHCNQSFTATGVFIGLKAVTDVTVTVLSVSEKQNDQGEPQEELLELAKLSIAAGNVQSVSKDCSINLQLNFIRLKITDSGGNLVDVELYAFGFTGITLTAD